MVMLDKKFIMENIENLLIDDNYFNFFSPEFGSYIFFELYKNNENQFFVKIIYNGIEMRNLKSITEKQELNGLIEMNKFNKLMDLLINENYQKLKC